MAPADHFESDTEIVLASASPRRRELLCKFGISFRVEASEVDETPCVGESSASLVRRLAETKARAIVASASNPDGPSGRLVVAADTTVALDGVILGKPVDDAEAAAMLRTLRDRDHDVLTGLALAVGDHVVWSSVVATTVRMRAYGDDEIARYVALGLPLDKAGAYGIQDAAFSPVAHIVGCYTNVVGLPLCEVGRALASSAPKRVRGVADADTLCDVLREAAGVVGKESCRAAPGP